MPRSKLPDFSAPTTAELRALWKRYKRADEEPDRTMRRLMMEVVHMREVVLELHSNFGIVQKQWYEETRSKLVAMEEMRKLFISERSRFGSTSSIPPPAPEGAEARLPAGVTNVRKESVELRRDVMRAEYREFTIDSTAERTRRGYTARVKITRPPSDGDDEWEAVEEGNLGHFADVQSAEVYGHEWAVEFIDDNWA